MGAYTCWKLKELVASSLPRSFEIHIVTDPRERPHFHSPDTWSLFGNLNNKLSSHADSIFPKSTQLGTLPPSLIRPATLQPTSSLVLTAFTYVPGHPYNPSVYEIQALPFLTSVHAHSLLQKHRRLTQAFSSTLASFALPLTYHYPIPSPPHPSPFCARTSAQAAYSPLFIAFTTRETPLPHTLNPFSEWRPE